MNMRFDAGTPRKRILELIAIAWDSWRKGDIDGVLAHATADIRFRTSYRETYPNGFEAVGKEACRQVSREMLIEIEPLGTEIRRIVIDGPRMALWRLAHIRKRGTGGEISVPVCNLCTFRDGLVCDYSEFTDIAALRALEDESGENSWGAQRARQIPSLDCLPQISTAEDSSAALRRDVIDQTIKLLYDRRSANDFAKIEEFFAPDFLFRCNSWPNRYTELQGIEQCGAAFRAHAVAFENLGNTIHDALIDGEQAAVRRTARVRNRGGGPAVDVDTFTFLTFRDGLIIEMEDFPDSEGIRRLADHG